MAVEKRRGCGFRKVGGMYLVCDGAGFGCNQLPFNLEVCPVCSQGIKPSRGFTWINPLQLFKAQECKVTCPMSPNCPLRFEGRQGLMWIGGGFYTPEDFIKEANEMGISKRIGALHQGFELGKTWVFLAHKKAGKKQVPIPDTTPEDVRADLYSVVKMEKEVPAVFYIFKPTRIEKIVTETQSKDEAEMKKLKDRGITPVAVPDDDKDHQGTVYDKKKEETATSTKNMIKLEE